jgi:diguanylate cyclase (GGDEF)-like protein/PAS domain S-box-containing protein
MLEVHKTGSGREEGMDSTRPDGIPTDTAGPMSISVAQHQGSSAMTSPGTILVVDDELIAREILAYLLEAHQYQLLQAEDGPQALAILEQQPPDIVLLDLTLPGMDGLEVLRRLRQRYLPTQLPVIMVTGNDQSGSIVKAFEIGANDYVTKPIDPPVILARIATQIGWKNALIRLHESEERYALAARGANDGLWDWNITRKSVYYSPRWKEMLGFQEDAIEEDPEEWFQRVHRDDQQTLNDRLSAHWEGVSSHFETEFRMQHRDGTYRWMLCRGLAVRNAEGQATRMAGSLTDITESKVADALTGLPNRILFLDRLERAIEQRRRSPDQMFAVLFLDLDGFKLINDSLGHDVGDQLLLEVSRRLEATLRSSDTVSRMSWKPTVARLGGDEFTILLHGLRSPLDAQTVAGRILRELAAPFHLHGHEVFATVSIGISVSTVFSVSTEEMVREADIAMYHAKIQGKNQYCMFDPSMRERAVMRLELEMNLRHAVEHEEFFLHYQPLVSLASGRCIGFEALVRWQHPRRGLISPADFIPLAEETGLIVPLGAWVLRQACRQTRAWQTQFPNGSHLFVSVNCASRQIVDPAFAGTVEAILRECDLAPQYLKLELTETSLMENCESTSETLRQLRELGIWIAIDDFGTGYSSLSYLQSMPIDVLKIDRSFVSRLDRTDESAEIVRTIIDLAHSLGITVVAEGVETARQIKRLQQLGCEYGQGFYFAPALDPDRAAREFMSTVPRSNETRQLLPTGKLVKVDPVGPVYG